VLHAKEGEGCGIGKVLLILENGTNLSKCLTVLLSAVEIEIIVEHRERGPDLNGA